MNGTDVSAVSLESILKLKDYRVNNTTALKALGEQLGQHQGFSLTELKAELSSSLAASKISAVDTARESIAWLTLNIALALNLKQSTLVYRLVEIKNHLDSQLKLESVSEAISYLGSEAQTEKDFFETLARILPDIQTVA